MARETADVVIIGGGVIGAAVAYFLTSRGSGSRVTVLEPDPSYARASTPKATGVIRQQFAIPENIRMCVFGSAFMKEAPSLLGTEDGPADIALREQGYVWLLEEDILPLAREMHEVQLQNGADVEFLDAQALGRRLPLFTTENLAGGFWGRSGAGWFDPWALLQAFRRKSQAFGVSWVKDRAVALARSGGRIAAVETAGGLTIATGHVVNCGGALGAKAVAAMAGVDLPVEPRRRSVFHIDCREDVRHFPMSVHLKTGVWFRPEGSGVLCGVAPVPENDPPTEDETVDHALFEEVVWPTIAALVPAFEAVKVRNAHACFYDFNTLDENAILGPAEGLSNFHLATGFSGHGVMQAPAAGRAIAELILDGRYTTLDLSRFGHGRIVRAEALPEPACF